MCQNHQNSWKRVASVGAGTMYQESERCLYLEQIRKSAKSFDEMRSNERNTILRMTLRNEGFRYQNQLDVCCIVETQPVAV